MYGIETSLADRCSKSNGELSQAGQGADKYLFTVHCPVVATAARSITRPAGI